MVGVNLIETRIAHGTKRKVCVIECLKCRYAVNATFGVGDPSASEDLLRAPISWRRRAPKLFVDVMASAWQVA